MTNHVHEPYTIMCNLQGGHTDSVVCMAFSPTGQYLASGSNDATLTVWDINTNAIVRQWHASSTVLSLCWDFAKDKHLFCGTQDGKTIVIGDFTDADSPSLVLLGLKAPVYGLSLCAASADLALSVGPEVNIARVHNSKTYTTYKILPKPASPAEASENGESHIRAITLQFLGDRRLLVSYLNHGVVCWDIKTDTQLWVIHRSDCFTAQFALPPDRLRIAVSNLNDGIRVYHLGQSDPITSIPVPAAKDANYIFGITFLEGGRLVALGSPTGEVKLWEASTGECLQTLRHKGVMIQAIAAYQGAGFSILATGSTRLGRRTFIKVWRSGSTGEQAQITKTRMSSSGTPLAFAIQVVVYLVILFALVKGLGTLMEDVSIKCTLNTIARTIKDVGIAVNNLPSLLKRSLGEMLLRLSNWILDTNSFDMKRPESGSEEGSAVSTIILRL